MLSFDSVLQNSLAAATTKLDWIARINVALGPNRVVRCFRDPDASAANPFLTGVEFLNIGNTGTITGAGGNISSFGKVANATIRKAADLSTGASILRIEGNGHWVQGTLGLKAQNLDADATNDHDFVMNTNPTAKAGFGMTAGMKSPPMLPSGTGPQAPNLDPDRPVYVELVDWRNQSVPVVVKTAVLSVRDENLVFDDPNVATEIGDVRLTFLDETIVYDRFEFGAMLLSCNPVVNGDNSAVLHQVLISCKPYGTWPSYPTVSTYNEHTAKNIVIKAGCSISFTFQQQYSVAEDITMTARNASTFAVVSSVRGALPDLTVGATYSAEPAGNAALAAFSCTVTGSTFVAGDKITFTVGNTYDDSKPRDVTCPPPFKINLKKIDGTILHTFQMRDGLPINSPLLSQKRTGTIPLRPKFNCAMMLPWTSATPKLNTKRRTYVPKAAKDTWRETQSRNADSFPGAVPLINGRDQLNSLLHYFSAPRWPVGSDLNTENNAADPNNDLYAYDIFTYSGDGAKRSSRAVGWGYEPGSISLHDWYTGPGGPRHDRAVLPTPIVLYLWNPTGLRPRDGSTLKENLDAYSLAYFNHSNYYFTNVKDFTTVSTDEVHAGQWVYCKAYYGEPPTEIPKRVPQFAIPNGSGAALKLDASGTAPWNGWAGDQLHNYCQPAWMTLLFNSPMHYIGAVHRYNAGLMAQLQDVVPTRTAGFLQRDGAWRWLHWALMWKLGTSHRLGVSRKSVEDRWTIDLELIYKQFVLPATDPANPGYNSLNSKALRALGQTVKVNQSYTGWCITHNCLAYYMTNVFLLMKQSGSWDVMYNKNDRCKKTLEFMMQCYDKFAVDFILDAKGIPEGGYPDLVTPLTASEVAAGKPFNEDLPTSWADYLVKHPATGAQDWAHGADGSFIGERENAQHLRASWVYMRKYYFPEFTYPRLDQALAAYQAYYDERTADIQAKIANGTAPFTIRNSDWAKNIPPFFRVAAPDATDGL